jgi:hypothetical protein
MWQRLVSRKISWDFTVLGKVIPEKGEVYSFVSFGR